MEDEELAKILLRDHLLAASALTALQLRQLSPDAQAHLNEAISSRHRPRRTAHADRRRSGRARPGSC